MARAKPWRVTALHLDLGHLFATAELQRRRGIEGYAEASSAVLKPGCQRLILGAAFPTTRDIGIHAAAPCMM
jgi:hypothetical protein